LGDIYVTIISNYD